jgi:hypothetical protein
MKPWYKSRTVWTNIGALALAVLSQNEWAQIIPPEHMDTFLKSVLVLNLILRKVTTEPIAARRDN